MKDKSGPSTLPCGTPDVTLRNEDDHYSPTSFAQIVGEPVQILNILNILNVINILVYINSASNHTSSASVMLSCVIVHSVI
jgi:hypothetical protein